MTTISITYNNVKQELLRMSEYVAAKAGSYDAMRAITEDDAQLRFWYQEGLTIVGVLLDRIIGKRIAINDLTDTTDIVLKETNNELPLLKDAISRLICVHILRNWLKLVAPSLVPLYNEQYNQAEQELVKLSYYREMPK